MVDLPGTYSLHPDSLDERVVLDALLGHYPGGAPEAVVYVAHAARLDKHLLLLTQVLDLGLPTVLALNFADEDQGVPGAPPVDAVSLSLRLGVPVVRISARTGEGLPALGEALAGLLRERSAGSPAETYALSGPERRVAQALASALPHATAYARVLVAHHGEAASTPAGYRIARAAALESLPPESSFESERLQVRETMQRFDRFLPLLADARRDADEPHALTQRIDAVATHPLWGPLLFGVLLLLVFTAIYEWATVPMDLIEAAFATAGEAVRATLPAGQLADLLVDGVLAGLAGVVVFVPQIAILFFLLAVLEDTGYMARAVFLADRVMQRFGLNGRSLVALTASGACAIPAVMSARTIANPKERLLTILVSPLISCSARLPVYAVLIGFAVPAATVAGVFSAQALAFVGIYLVSIAAALLSALLFRAFIPDAERSYLMIELPDYRMPSWRNVAAEAWVKTRAFLLGAGKIILAISVVLWVLASYGPGDRMDLAAEEARSSAVAKTLDADATADAVAEARLAASYAGHLGRAIEPAIEPLGYDWRIGIALVTSFAAREVFVGTIATLYAIGSADDDEARVVERLSEARRPDGLPVYNRATAFSLIVFYLFAMQCMSTLAVVRRETGKWRWPLLQVVYMTGLAYLAALLTYQALS